MTATTSQRGRKAVKDFGDSLGEAETLLQQAATETGQRASDLLSQVAAKLGSAKSMLRDLPEDFGPALATPSETTPDRRTPPAVVATEGVRPLGTSPARRSAYWPSAGTSADGCTPGRSKVETS